MRTEQQIKRKLNEFTLQKAALSSQVTGDPGRDADVLRRMEQLEDAVMLLEWVLNEPSGNYHA